MQLFWSDADEPVSISSDLKMPQFTIEKVASTVCNEQFHLGEDISFDIKMHCLEDVFLVTYIKNDKIQQGPP